MSDAPKPEPVKFSKRNRTEPSLDNELDELQGPISVEDLETAASEASARIAEVVAEAQAQKTTLPPPIAAPYIVFDKVSIAFGDRKILDEVSFHVGRGQTLCILGRSGVGKSVSLRILLGFLKADSGSIR